ncbi:MAG: DUF3160 domain-containing protein [Sedimentisphaerales bacterium]|nr:DUF3160 domain-containing protein [Sedimentisphaerales bacterium]
MKSPRTLFFVFACVISAKTCLAQVNSVEVDAYREFLDQHKDMSTSELLAMHPAGDFKEDVGPPWESVVHHELIDAQYSLTAYEKSLLEKNGFVVTERLRNGLFLDQLLDIWRKDLPLFISTDALLHAVHYYYSKWMLSDIESGALCSLLEELLSRMHTSIPMLSAKYADTTDMWPMLEDVDLYLTVAQRLLGEDSATPCVIGNATLDEILDLIDAEGMAPYPLFSQTCREIDFSQFTPRGHYAQNERLAKYFRAMMWLGRTEMYLLAPQNVAVGPCPRPRPEDIQRQTIDAVLVLELMDLAGVKTLYNEIEDVLSLLVGEQDNVTVEQLQYVLEAADITDARSLLDPIQLQTFQQRLAEESFAFQRILSQVLRHDPTTPESVQPASAFMLFGQRFVIDSYITGNVVGDKITYQDQLICRLFPSTLDVMAGLGNNVALELLVPELEQYHYSSNLAALRYLIDSHDAAFWDNSIYNMWLNSIRALNPPRNRDSLPLFMQTTAWWHQKLNTQLASWIQLRHDNLLYAKQSFTSGYSCSYPCAYVEPFPEFYQHLNNLAVTAHAKFEALDFSHTILKKFVVHWYDHLAEVTETLATIARKELDNVPLTEEEITFTKQMLYKDSYGSLEGWYIVLLYGYPIATHTDAFEDYLVADYHTTPTDCAGNTIGAVLHAGTGPVDLAIITAEAPGTAKAAFVGPVMSYYEYTTTDFQRLTDEEWESTYLPQATRPAWTSSFLANESGEPY